MASDSVWFGGLSVAVPLDGPYAEAARLEPRAESRAEPGAGVAVDLADLVRAHSALLFRVANSILRNPAEAEDVVQDVFVRVVEREQARRGSLNEVREMRVWLVRIAWNLSLSRRRRVPAEQMDDAFAAGLAAESVPADQVVEEAQRMKAVVRELERLPKAERHVLLLSAAEELETAEIAAVMGKSESAVRALLFRARTRLRERLERQEGKR
jgi:RNA polymerase sigma-70 factor (ECF subfamily)